MLIQIKNITREKIYKLAEITAEGFKDNPGFQLWGEDSNSRHQKIMKEFVRFGLKRLDLI